MPAVSRSLRFIIGGALALVAASLVTYAAPLATQLGLLIDASGRIGASNVNTAISGKVSALSALPTDGSVEVAALTLSPGTVEGPDPIIFTAATLPDAIAAVNGMTYVADATATTAGIDAIPMAGSARFNGPLNPLSNVPPNGAPHVSNQPGVTAAQAAVHAANAAGGKGIDALTAGSIGGAPGNNDPLKDLGFSPINDPCNGCGTHVPGGSAPSNPMTLNPGLLPAKDLDDFPTAIKTKDQVATSQVPEPGVLMLLALGLACLGIARHRRSA